MSLILSGLSCDGDRRGHIHRSGAGRTQEKSEVAPINRATQAFLWGNAGQEGKRANSGLDASWGGGAEKGGRGGQQLGG
jgi:hypothetical protein